MAGFEAGSGPGAGAVGGSGGFRLGPYTFRWSDPKSYLLMWVLATMVLLVVAGFAPAIAVAFAAAVLFGTLIGATQLGRP